MLAAPSTTLFATSAVQINYVSFISEANPSSSTDKSSCSNAYTVDNFSMARSISPFNSGGRFFWGGEIRM